MNTKEIPVEASRYAELDQEARAIYRALHVHPERMYAVVLDSDRWPMLGIPIPAYVYRSYLADRLETLKAQMSLISLPDPEEPFIAPNP